MIKRKNLINSYETFMAESFFGLGQYKAKLFMNSLLKKLDAQIKMAPGDTELVNRRNALKFLRAILECENCNINAKKYFNTKSFSYSDSNYNRKRELIIELLSVAQNLGVEYGYAKSNDPATKHIVYFDLPQTGEQVSFHSNLDQNVIKNVPEYKKEWDKQTNSSLRKIENAFCVIFGSELKKKYKIEDKQNAATLASESNIDIVNNKKCVHWVIRQRPDKKYIIVDAATGEVLHDAQGFGFRSSDKAYNFGHQQYSTEPDDNHQHGDIKSLELF